MDPRLHTVSHFFNAREREACDEGVPDPANPVPPRAIAKSKEIKLRSQFPHIMAKIQEAYENFNNYDDVDNFLKADILTTLRY